jgi:hypothetical protein
MDTMRSLNIFYCDLDQPNLPPARTKVESLKHALAWPTSLAIPPNKVMNLPIFSHLFLDISFPKIFVLS